MSKKDKDKPKLSVKNRKASFNYEFLETYTAGIILEGAEIKSISEGKVSISEAYCIFINGELWMRGSHVAEHNGGFYSKHEPLRDRKLLLTKKELKKLSDKMKDKGLTIVPTRLFRAERGHIKIDIAMAKGKKNFNKKQSIKERDLDREMRRKDDE